MKYSAEEFSLAGDRFLGQPYSKMDCQTFVENAMRQIGLDMNLKGSNAWYREVRKNGWVGSPEECTKKFGSVPKGALLFIHAFDGGEEKVGYHDGLGNASHIGIKTGRTGADMVRRATEAGASNAGKFNFGDGAIHSSSTREHVSTSKFADRTISGGGWNCVGLYKKFSYGEAIDKILDGGSPAPSPDPEPVVGKTMKIYAENGQPVNMRYGPSTAKKIRDVVPVGEIVTVSQVSGSWSKVTWKGKTGWMMTKFLVDPDAPVQPVPVSDTDTLGVTVRATVTSENGMPVKLRQKASTACGVYDEIPVGTEVVVNSYKDDWCMVSYGSRKKWFMMTKFLEFG